MEKRRSALPTEQTNIANSTNKAPIGASLSAKFIKMKRRQWKSADRRFHENKQSTQTQVPKRFDADRHLRVIDVVK
jgi:hypothetical protein